MNQPPALLDLRRQPLGFAAWIPAEAVPDPGPCYPETRAQMLAMAFHLCRRFGLDLLAEFARAEDLATADLDQPLAVIAPPVLFLRPPGEEEPNHWLRMDFRQWLDGSGYLPTG